MHEVWHVDSAAKAFHLLATAQRSGEVQCRRTADALLETNTAAIAGAWP